MFRQVIKSKQLFSLPLALSSKLPKKSILSFFAQPAYRFQGPVSRYSFAFTPRGETADPTPAERIKKGYDYLNQGNIKKAKSSFRTALEDCLEQKPVDLQQQSQALVGLGSIHTVQGETKEALKNLHEAEEVLKKFETEDKAVLSHLAYLLGRNYRQIENYPEALKYAQDAIKIHTENSLEEDAKVGLMYYNLGIVYRNTQDLEKAKPNFVKAIECFEKDSSADGGQLFFIYLELGYLLVAKSDFAEAAKYLERAAKGIEKEEGVRPSVKAELYYNLGKCNREIQNNDIAAKYYLKVVDSVRANIPDKDEKTHVAGILEATAQDLIELEKFGEVIPTLEKTLELAREVGTEQTATGGILYHYLGMAYGYKQDLENSLKYLNESVKIKTNVLGKDHIEVGFALQSLGMTFLAVNKMEEGEQCLKNAQRVFKTNFGEGHPIYNDLQETLKMIDKLPPNKK